MEQSTDPYRRPLLILCSLFALTRLALLWFNEAEFTDAYNLFSWAFRNGGKWHPLYPLLLQGLANLLDPILAGRLISAICGILTLPILFSMTDMIYGKRSAFLACCLFFVSPQGLWIETRVLTESLFVFLALTSLLYFLRAWKQDRRWDLCFLFFFSGLSILTRPEGLVFVPLLLFASLRTMVRGYLKNILYALPGMAPWIFFLLWFYLRSSGANYQNELLFSVNTLSLGKVILYIVSYLEAYPFVLTYPVFLLFLFNRAKRPAMWVFLLVYIHAIWFALLAVHWAWTTRFLIFPSILLLIEAASMLKILENRFTASTRKILLSSVFLFSFLFAATALFFQRETYADVKDSALFVREQRKTQRVFSDEFFKVKYYLGTRAIPYSRDAQFQPGDIVIFHSFHTALANELIELSRNYKLSLVYKSSAKTIPILANGLVATADENNLPSVLQERFHVQRFESIVIQILAIRKP